MQLAFPLSPELENMTRGGYCWCPTYLTARRGGGGGGGLAKGQWGGRGHRHFTVSLPPAPSFVAPSAPSSGTWCRFRAQLRTLSQAPNDKQELVPTVAVLTDSGFYSEAAVRAVEQTPAGQLSN